MKIKPYLSWQLVSRTLSKLWPASKDVKTDEISNRLSNKPNQFHTWKNSMGPLSLEQEKYEVNLVLLEQFIAESTAQDMSYESLISSHLQHDSIEGESMLSIEQMLAKQKLLALVARTIADMKKIDLNHVSYQKG